MTEDGDSEYEEEEMIVLAELNGLVDDQMLKKGCTYQFVGIDTDKPVLQLGKYNFLGSYEDQIGSALFLSQEADKTWSKLCFSDKKLSMQRVFLRKKGEEPPVPLQPAGEGIATERDSLSAAGTEPAGEEDQEPGSSAVAEERRPEAADGEEPATAAAGDSADVEMIPAEDSETAPPRPPDPSCNPAEENEP